MVKRAVLVITVALLFIGGPGKAATLTKDGHPNSLIVVSPELSPIERYAAEELRDYIYKISGAQLEIVGEDHILSKEVPCFVVIGTKETSEKIRGLDLNIEDGLAIRVTENNVYLIGATEQDVLYAVYAFLEELLGVRWIWPGDAGEVVPQNNTINIEVIEKKEKPGMKFRGYHLCWDHVNDEAEKWMARNRMNYLFTPPSVFRDPSKHYIIERRRQRGFKIVLSAHTMGTFFPSDLIQEHPEYFVAINGRHIKGNQPKFCHPEVKRITKEAIYKMLDEIPHPDILTISPYDNTLFGECEIHPNESVSTMVYQFIDDIAKEIAIDYPKVRIMGYGYSSYSDAPEIEPSTNLAINFATFHCYNHGFSCMENAKHVSRLQDWQKLGYMCHIRDYYSGVVAAPAPLAYRIADDISFWDSQDVEGFISEIVPPNSGPDQRKIDWEMNMWTYYVGAKMMWDPDLDYKEVLQDGFEAYYGPATEVMFELYNFLEMVWRGNPSCVKWNSNVASLLLKFIELDRDYLFKIANYYVEALKTVVDQPAFKERVDRYFEFLGVWEQAYLDMRVWRIEIPIIETPTLDGKIEKIEWEKASTITGFVTEEGKYVGNTKVYLGWDKEGLLLAFEASEPWEEIKVEERSEGNSSAYDNSLEVYLDPNFSWSNYLYFAISRTGTKFEAACDYKGNTNDGWNCEWKGKTFIDEGKSAWSAEIKIPFKSLGKTPKAGERWLFNVGRFDSVSSLKSTWTDGKGHMPQSFGTIVFQE